MAKTIKFNLICDNKPIRTIEDLQENFSVEDVLTYYRNGLLKRWLFVRGYEKELCQLQDINSEDSLTIIKELIKIFDITADMKQIEEGVYMLEFLDEHKELCSRYEKHMFKKQSIIDDYQTGYYQLVQGILDNPSDAARIKANIEEMSVNYRWVLKINHRELFWTLYDSSVLAIMCLLMNEKTRHYYLPVEETEQDEEVIVDDAIAEVAYASYDTPAEVAYASYDAVKDDSKQIPESHASLVFMKKHAQYKADKQHMFDAICALIDYFSFNYKLGDNLITFAGETAGYWKDLEPKGKKYMIISMGSGDFVRSSGVTGGDLSSSDVKNAFVILDGIDYKSNSSSRQLRYMEV